jgi:hypothetical protein
MRHTFVGVLLLMLILTGCSSLNKKTVQRAFLQDHPGYKVVGITEDLDSGDVPYADFTIKYTKPSDQSSHEDVWHYYDLKDTSYVIKETVK